MQASGPGSGEASFNELGSLNVEKRKVNENQSRESDDSFDPVPTVMKKEKWFVGHRSPDDLCFDLLLC